MDAVTSKEIVINNNKIKTIDMPMIWSIRDTFMENQCYESLFLVDESSFLSGRADLIVWFAKLIRVPYKLDCFKFSSISAIFRTRTWNFKNIQKLQQHEGRHRITGSTTLDTARVCKK